jgi:HTH-type transcriptional regulator, competence development regulator
MNKSNPSALGQYLRGAREARQLSLREVERQVGVSNAYLSQVESGRIKEPSPNVLFKLTELYGAAYEIAMELAGYPTPTESSKAESFGRLGPVSPAELSQLTEYLSFLRRRKRGTGEK